jgi:hypothetical protein
VYLTRQAKKARLAQPESWDRKEKDDVGFSSRRRSRKEKKQWEKKGRQKIEQEVAPITTNLPIKIDALPSDILDQIRAGVPNRDKAALNAINKAMAPMSGRQKYGGWELKPIFIHMDGIIRPTLEYSLGSEKNDISKFVDYHKRGDSSGEEKNYYREYAGTRFESLNGEMYPVFEDNKEPVPLHIQILGSEMILKENTQKLVQLLQDGRFVVELAVQDNSFLPVLCTKLKENKYNSSLSNVYSITILTSIDFPWRNDATEPFNFFPNLRNLQLDNVIVTNAHLRSIGGLLNLEEFIISYQFQQRSYITDKGLEHLKSLKKLTALDLSNSSEIKGHGLSHLKDLNELFFLKLSNCYSIEDSGLVGLQNFEQLIYLFLNNCHLITDEGLNHIKNLKNLEYLILQSCIAINGEGFKHLENMPNLWSIVLSSSNLMDNGLNHLKKMANNSLRKKKIIQLYLDNCENITEAGLAHLSGLTQLTELSLVGCNKITDAGLARLSGLTQLKELNLAGCSKITDAGLSHLNGLTQLTELGLTECSEITDAGLAHLSGLTQLTELGFAECSENHGRGASAPKRLDTTHGVRFRRM